MNTSLWNMDSGPTASLGARVRALSGGASLMRQGAPE